MNRVLKQEFSDKIRDQLVSIYPEAKENLDQIFFSFVDVKSIVILSELKEQPRIRNSSDKSLVISVNNLNPLAVESLFFVLQQDCSDKTFKFDNFLSFLESFNKDTLTIPPLKKHLNILSKWFVENVDWQINFNEEKNTGSKRRILKWKIPGTRKYKKVLIPESMRLKDVVSSILSTGTIKNMRPQKSMDLERI